MERVDWTYPEKDMNDRLEIQNIKIKKFNRKTNHIISYLDRITVYDRIRNDDITIETILPQFTMAQITEFIRIAIENNSTNISVILLEHKNQHYSDYNAMDEFSLEL